MGNHWRRVLDSLARARKTTLVKDSAVRVARMNWCVLTILMAFWNGGYAWYKPLRSWIESSKSAERFKNYTFLPDSVGGMAIDSVHQQGGILKIWNLLNEVVDSFDNVIDYQIEKGRIGVLFDNGILLVRDLTTGDSLLEKEIIDFQLEDNRIAVLTNAKQDDEVLKVKDGSLNARWVEAYRAGFIKSFQLENFGKEKRIGVLVKSKGDDILNVQEGSLTANWQVIHRSPTIHSFQLEWDRIGVLCESADTFRIGRADASLNYVRYNRVLIKQGELDAPFIVVREHFHADTTLTVHPQIPDTIVRVFQMKNDRVAILERISWSENSAYYQYDEIWAQEGPAPRTDWQKLDRRHFIRSFQLEGDRIAVLFKMTTSGNDILEIKEGPLNADWRTIHDGPLIRSFQLKQDHIALLEEKNLLIKKGATSTAWDTLPGMFDSFVLSVYPGAEMLTMAGYHLAVRSKGAGFQLHPSFINVSQRLPYERMMGNLKCTLPVHWNLRRVSSGAVFLVGNGTTPYRQQLYWLRINGDALMMLQSHLGEKLEFEVLCHGLKDTTIYATPNLMLLDSLGGMSFMPIGWRWWDGAHFYDDTYCFDLTGGQYFYVSVFPPKEFDWGIGDERIFWHWDMYDPLYPYRPYLSNGYIDSLADTAICDFNKNSHANHRNIILLQSETAMWKHWNRGFEPREPETLRVRIAKARANNLSIMLYTSPWNFTKGSFDYSDYDEPTGYEAMSVYYGENSEEYLAAVDTLINSSYSPDGIYLDGIYQANLPETYRVIKQVKEMMYKKKGLGSRVMYHCTNGLLAGERGVFCPAVDAYADFVTRGEYNPSMYPNYPDNYYQRYISAYNMSNSVGVICNYGFYEPIGIENIPQDSAFGWSNCRSNFLKYRIKIQNLKSLKFNARVPMWKRLFLGDPAWPYLPKPCNIWHYEDYRRYLGSYPRNQIQFSAQIREFGRLPPSGLPDSMHYITLITPRDGGRFEQGDTCVIRYQCWGVHRATIEYSTDAGMTFDVIKDTSPVQDAGDVGSNVYAWEIPPTTFEDCLIRVTGQGLPPIEEIGLDVSDVPFSISWLTSCDSMATSGNGNRIVYEGSVLHVVFTSEDAIFYSTSTDAGFSWIKKRRLDLGEDPALAIDGVRRLHLVYKRGNGLCYYEIDGRATPLVVYTPQPPFQVGDPSLVIIGDKGYIVFKEYESSRANERVRLKLATFEINDPSRIHIANISMNEGERLKDPHLLIGMNLSPHIVGEKGDSVFYSSETVEGSLGAGRNPQIALDDEIVTVVWEYRGEIFYRAKKCAAGFDATENISNSPYRTSKDPIILTPRLIMWFEASEDNTDKGFDLVYSTLESGNWSAPIPAIFNRESVYGPIGFFDGECIYWLFTYGNQSPYEIRSGRIPVD